MKNNIKISVICLIGLIIATVCQGHFLPLNLTKFVTDEVYRLNYVKDQNLSNGAFRSWAKSWEFEYDYKVREGEIGKGFDFREGVFYTFEYYPHCYTKDPNWQKWPGRILYNIQIYFEDEELWHPSLMSTMVVKKASVKKILINGKTVMQSFADLHNEIQTPEFHGN